MIRIKESYNLQPIRNFMKKAGFEEYEGYLTDLHDHLGTLMFKAYGFTAIYGYPQDKLTFNGEKSVSSFSTYVKNIKRIDVYSAHLDIYTADGSVAEIWN